MCICIMCDNKSRNYDKHTEYVESEDLRFWDLATEVFKRFPTMITKFIVNCWALIPIVSMLSTN